jgi:hypothetical protein
VIGKAKCDKLGEVIWGFDAQADTRALFELLAKQS